MAIALIALLLIELLLLALWAPFFFRTGIALFNQRIAATPAELAQLSLASLEHDLPPDTWLCLVFRALPDGSIAFRESFVPSVGRRYFPLMRGRVMIDARRREVRVVGLCSWFALGLTLMLVPVILVDPLRGRCWWPWCCSTWAISSSADAMQTWLKRYAHGFAPNFRSAWLPRRSRSTPCVDGSIRALQFRIVCMDLGQSAVHRGRPIPALIRLSPDVQHSPLPFSCLAASGNPSPIDLGSRFTRGASAGPADIWRFPTALLRSDRSVRS